MLVAASERVQLRHLFPYLSLERTLKVSATTEYPYSEGIPYIRYVDSEVELDGSRYEVRDRDHRPTTFVKLEAALDFLIDRLPPSGAKCDEHPT